MISFLNRKLRSFLFVILVLVAAAFIFIDVPTSGLTGSRNLGEIRGEAVTRTDFQNYFRETELSFTLTTGQMMSQIPGMQDLMIQETWNRLITLKAAEDAGISVSAEEVTDYVTGHPLFQENGQFSAPRFQQFAAVFFDPPGVSISKGMNLEKFESAVRHQLMIEKFNLKIQAAAVTTDAEVTSLIERLHGTSSIKVATLSRKDVAQSFKMDEQELAAYYQQNIERYKTAEKRSLEYVYFKLPAAASKSEADQKAALRSLGEKAFRFSDPFYQAVQDQVALPDFAAEAANAGLYLLQATSFSATETPSGIQGAERLVQAAFSLTLEAPVSDAIPVADGFIVAHLVEIQPGEALPLEQAGDQVRKDFRKREIQRGMSIEGRQKALQLRELVAGGTTWDAALKEAGFKASPNLQLVPSLAMRNQEDSEVSRLAARSASAMEINEISPFELVGDIGYVFYVSDRTPPASDIVADNRDATQQQLVAQQGAMLVREWVKSQYNAPGTDLPMLNTENL